MKPQVTQVLALAFLVAAATWSCGGDENGVDESDDTGPVSDVATDSAADVDDADENDDAAIGEVDGDIQPCPVEACEESLLCAEQECGETAYFCTYLDGSWDWRTEAGCDDGDPCTYDDVCEEDACAGTEITCTSVDCLQRSCNGTDACTETPLSNATSCGSIACESDYCDSSVHYDYPATCTRYCDGLGSCASCSCSATPTSCEVSGGDPCCTATCDTTTGCATESGECADLCSTTSLTTGRTCSGCGDNLASGTCDGGSSTTCDAGHTCEMHSCGGTPYECNDDGGSWEWRASTVCAADHACDTRSCGGTPYECNDEGGSWEWRPQAACGLEQSCDTRSCGGTTYYCTNSESTWEWRTATACDDGNACTDNDVCSGSTCVGVAVSDGTACNGGLDLCRSGSCNSTECYIGSAWYASGNPTEGVPTAIRSRRRRTGATVPPTTRSPAAPMRARPTPVPTPPGPTTRTAAKGTATVRAPAKPRASARQIPPYRVRQVAAAWPYATMPPDARPRPVAAPTFAARPL